MNKITFLTNAMVLDGQQFFAAMVEMLRTISLCFWTIFITLVRTITGTISWILKALKLFHVLDKILNIVLLGISALSHMHPLSDKLTPPKSMFEITKRPPSDKSPWFRLLETERKTICIHDLNTKVGAN